MLLFVVVVHGDAKATLRQHLGAEGAPATLLLPSPLELGRGDSVTPLEVLFASLSYEDRVALVRVIKPQGCFPVTRQALLPVPCPVPLAPFSVRERRLGRERPAPPLIAPLGF